MNTIWSYIKIFLESNFFQSLILIVTILVTYRIYIKKERNQLKAAATILALQIKNIEKNIEYLKAEGVIGESICEQPIHYSIPIFEENMWEKYKHVFASRLRASDFASIELFYEVAQAIRMQQYQIKQKIQENVFAKTAHYYQQQFSRINACVTDKREDRVSQCLEDILEASRLYNNPQLGIMTFIHKEFGIGLIKGLSRYQRLSGTVTFENLCKQGKIKI